MLPFDKADRNAAGRLHLLMTCCTLSQASNAEACALQCRSASGDADDDDWEQTADRTPRGPTAPQGSAQASTSGRKAYTLDWMLHQQDQPECQGLPKDFEAGDLVAIGWRQQMGPMQGGAFEGPTRVPGGGRGVGGPPSRNMGVPRGVAPPPGVGMGGGPDKWQQSGPPAPMPGQGQSYVGLVVGLELLSAPSQIFVDLKLLSITPQPEAGHGECCSM